MSAIMASDYVTDFPVWQTIGLEPERRNTVGIDWRCSIGLYILQRRLIYIIRSIGKSVSRQKNTIVAVLSKIIMNKFARHVLFYYLCKGN